jgi:hypothetical protein
MLENNKSVDVAEEAAPTESLDHPVNQSRSPNAKKALAMSDVLTRFTSCGRCSLFLAAYRIINDDQVLKTAISNSDGEWLPLPWDQVLRKLIVKSYGCRLDVDVYFFESSCPECLGKFRYLDPESDEPAFLLFKI